GAGCPGYSVLTPASGSATVTLPAGASAPVENVDFGFQESNTVSGTIRGQALLPNGAQGAAQPLAGWTVQLVDLNGQVVATTPSDDQGRYQFFNVPLGDYNVRQVVPAGWRTTAPFEATPGFSKFTATTLD